MTPRDSGTGPLPPISREDSREALIDSLTNRILIRAEDDKGTPPPSEWTEWVEVLIDSEIDGIRSRVARHFQSEAGKREIL